MYILSVSKNITWYTFLLVFKIVESLQYILKFGTCYITGHWGEFRVNNATLCLHLLFDIFLSLFIKKFVFLPFFFIILMKYQISSAELVLRNCQWNCMFKMEDGWRWLIVYITWNIFQYFKTVVFLLRYCLLVKAGTVKDISLLHISFCVENQLTGFYMVGNIGR